MDDQTTNIIIISVVALLLGGGTLYVLFSKDPSDKNDNKEGTGAGSSSVQVQLQAYERLIILTERIAIPNLISRVNQPGLSAKEMQALLTQSIKEEFNYNITQQIYVSADAWAAVKNLKEQNILIINQISNVLPPNATGLDLNKKLLEYLMNDKMGTLHEVVSEVLSYEAKKSGKRLNFSASALKNAFCMSDKKRYTDSGIEIKQVYTSDDLANVSPLEAPGEAPFTRGIQPDMYRGKLWTMRQYAGFSTAEESNKRYHYLLSHGVMGLSVAFDLPTQIGYDSDHTLSEGEVGKVGVAIDSIEDMQRLFNGIKLEDVSTSMTINATGFILLALYVAVAKQQGADLKKISGTIQNDILKEYAARGTYIYPPKQSMRIITDIFEWCSKELPKWNTISISGYHIREAGSTAVQEVAFTLSNGKAYLKAALDRGLDINVFGKRLSFFFNAHNNLFEEVAKFRAARRMWATTMKQLGATDEKAMMLRFHTQTGGSTLTAQQPLNNVSRVTIQALAAVLGGTQSLHTNGYDEALSLPTEEAARTALRTQQVVAFESGVTDTADPLAGSYFVESLTNEIEQKAWQLIDKIDTIGGSVQAIEEGFIQDEIARSAYEYQRKIENGEKIIVGVNRFAMEEENKIPLLKIDDSIQGLQSQQLKALREKRDKEKVTSCLQYITTAAKENTNLIPFIIEAVENFCTLGEVADALREVFGEYK